MCTLWAFCWLNQADYSKSPKGVIKFASVTPWQSAINSISFLSDILNQVPYFIQSLGELPSDGSVGDVSCFNTFRPTGEGSRSNLVNSRHHPVLTRRLQSYLISKLRLDSDTLKVTWAPISWSIYFQKTVPWTTFKTHLPLQFWNRRFDHSFLENHS